MLARSPLPVSLSRRMSVSASVCVNSLRDADEREALEDYHRHWRERYSAERIQNIAEGGDRSDPVLQQIDELENKIEGARMLDKDFDTNYPAWEADVHEAEESYVQDDDEKIEELLARIRESTMAAVSRSTVKRKSSGSFSFKSSGSLSFKSSGSFKAKVVPEQAVPSAGSFRSRTFRPPESFETFHRGASEQLAEAAIIEETREDIQEIPEEWLDDQAEPHEKPAQFHVSPIGKSSRPQSASTLAPISDRKRPTTILEQIESRKHTIEGMGCACDFV